MLVPNNKQKSKLYECANVSRWAYNWTLSRQRESYLNGSGFIFDTALRRELTQLKKTEDYAWLNNYSNNITKQAIKDACNAYLKFFRGQTRYPKFKSKKKCKPSFYQDNVKIQFSNTHVRLEKLTNSRKLNKQKINWIKLAEHNRFPKNVKYLNPRVTYDGINWWISVGFETEKSLKTPNNEGIGIDLGLKDLATCSSGEVYANINKTQKIKKIEKKKRRIQRKISKKYQMNKECDRYKKTKNITKKEKQILKLYHRLTNIRNQYQHDVTNDIVNREPMFITIEDININGMMRNRHLAKAFHEQALFQFTRKLIYKSIIKNIEIRQVDRYYPSSKLCSDCGHKNTLLKLSQREWVCPECGVLHDRDINASKNLKHCKEYKIIT